MTLSAFSVELNVGTPIGDYRLPVITGAAKPQEGGGIARLWLENPIVYPGIPMPNDDVCDRGDSGGYRQLFC